ncbi:hypothetical protein [Dyadobacter sp. CY312]|uniref:hypothetical protein n=1 Tax=Dyadobacter sp. CY312 TaxID=2907303 RepID=UPI001F3ADB42|nr:hypothetical protein [Dyadobacter sp. CY312]MCE7039225.1 hypothetical protein [Dyadobacter sp. CY312]
MNNALKNRIVRKILITKAFGHYESEEVLYEFPNRENVFYSHESPRFDKKSEDNDLKIINLASYGRYLADKYIWIDPIRHCKSPLFLSYLKIGRKNKAKKFLERHDQIVAGQIAPDLAVKPKRPRKVAPVKIVY